MNNEEKRKNLEALLSSTKFDWEFIHPSNIAEPILLIKNYTPSTGNPSVSFAFTLAEYYRGNSGEMGCKCWMTCSKVREINDDHPRPCDEYKEFCHGEVKYFPFSAKLHEYTYDCIGSIRELCENLYDHLVFGE